MSANSPNERVVYAAAENSDRSIATFQNEMGSPSPIWTAPTPQMTTKDARGHSRRPARAMAAMSTSTAEVLDETSMVRSSVRPRGVTHGRSMRWRTAKQGDGIGQEHQRVQRGEDAVHDGVTSPQVSLTGTCVRSAGSGRSVHGGSLGEAAIGSSLTESAAIPIMGVRIDPRSVARER